MAGNKETLPLVVGGVYVCKDEMLARYITTLEDGYVYYFDFAYPEADELYNPTGRCNRAVFRRWAKRMLSDAEVFALPVEDLFLMRRAILREEAECLSKSVLDALPDEKLQEELRKRGYGTTNTLPSDN